MSKVGASSSQHQSMTPAYIGWAIGGLLIAAAQPLAFTFGPFALGLGVLVTAWVSIRAPRHRLVGALAAVGLGLAAGFAALSLLLGSQT